MTKNKMVFIGLVSLFLIMPPLAVIATPITYYNLDFEDGSFGGGGTIFGEAENVSSSYLDGRSLSFDLNDQVVWNLNNVDSTTHHIGFDYYANAGANLTQFLDVPSILRLDVNSTGRHHVDIYYDFPTQQASSFLDGVLDSRLMTVTAWGTSPTTSQIRIANQSSMPGASRGVFEIDNLVWTGNSNSNSTPVPEPSTMLLFAAGLAGLAGVRIRKKK